MWLRIGLQGYSGFFVSGQAAKTPVQQGSQAGWVLSPTSAPEPCIIYCVRFIGSGIKTLFVRELKSASCEGVWWAYRSKAHKVSSGQICFVAIEISFRWTSVAQIKEDGGLRECWNYTCHVCVWWQKSRRPGFSFENIFWDVFVRWMERSSSRGSQWLIVTHAFGWIETSGMFLWVSNREKQEWASQCVHTLLSALHWVINSLLLFFCEHKAETRRNFNILSCHRGSSLSNLIPASDWGGRAVAATLFDQSFMLSLITVTGPTWETGWVFLFNIYYQPPGTSQISQSTWKHESWLVGTCVTIHYSRWSTVVLKSIPHFQSSFKRYIFFIHLHCSEHQINVIIRQRYLKEHLV